MLENPNSEPVVMTPNVLRCDPGAAGDSSRHFRSHLFREADTCERCGETKLAVAKKAARAKSAKSGRVDANGMMHFALVKGADYDSKSGARLDAFAAAKRLLDVGFWPLWEHTPGRIVVDAGDRVCIYLSGASAVVATARIVKVQPWSRSFSAAYPLVLGGTPELVLSLGDVMYLSEPVAAIEHVNELDCVGANKRKWGAAFCGGMRTMTPHDFKLLTSATGGGPGRIGI